MAGDDKWLGGIGRNWKGTAHPKAVPRGRHRCPECRGRGLVPGISKVQGLGKGMGSDYGPCPDCGGMGWIGEADPPPT